MLRRFNLNNVVVLPWALLFKRKTPCALPLSSIPTWKGWTPYRFSKGYRHKPVKYRLLWLINKINLLTIVAIDLCTKCSVTVAMVSRFSENKKRYKFMLLSTNLCVANLLKHLKSCQNTG